MTVIARRRILAAAVCGLTAIACGKRGIKSIPPDSIESVLSLRKLKCEECGATATKALREEPGVYDVQFDKNAAEAKVFHDPNVPVERLVAVVQKAGFDARPGAGAGEYVGRVEFPEGLDVAAIAQGDAVEIERHLVAGKITVFDFFAVWCAPCKKVDKHMLAVMQAQPDIALRKIDVVDWDSAVAARYLGDVPNLPYVVVYGVDGRRVATISGLHLDEIDAAIAKGRGG